MPRVKVRIVEPERTDVCGACAHSHKLEGGELQCRRLPPVFAYEDDNTYIMFPEVEERLWCGEFKQRLSS
jgi:hypothetical protein